MNQNSLWIDMNAGTPPTPTLPNTLLAPIMAPKTLDVQIARRKVLLTVSLHQTLQAL